ncbi:MAG: GCN5-related N-acetyltransferase [Candidatus Eremiobacteraeota bacterium]|nr:GCN5-related N-acetyltransferase [Candidatus Eremiobacteraeota bacterium]
MARPTWRIHPKGARDAHDAVVLLAEVAREGRWIATVWPFDLTARAEAMRTELLGRRVVGWCAVDGRTMVGDLTVYGVAYDEPEFGMIVAASHRQRGIGRALIENAAAWARANGKAALRLRVFPDNAPALALYRSVGFVEVQVQPGAIPRTDGAPLDVILMRLPTGSAR